MKLYLIKRDDGMFLRKIEGHYSAHVGQDKNAWSRDPAYILRTPDGVAMNLRKLCSEVYFKKDRWGFRQIQWRNFDPEKMARYEVVVMDVDIVSMRATPAVEFVQMDKVASIPLTKEGRDAA